MTTRQSINFSTATPLPANGIFAPQIWDDLLEFSSIVLSINCSGAPVIVNIYQSSDRININFSESFTIYPDALYNNTIQLYTRFFKLELVNPTGTNQTVSNTQVVDVVGGTYISGAIGGTRTVTLTHDSTTRSDTTSSVSTASRNDSASALSENIPLPPKS